MCEKTRKMYIGKNECNRFRASPRTCLDELHMLKSKIGIEKDKKHDQVILKLRKTVEKMTNNMSRMWEKWQSMIKYGKVYVKNRINMTDNKFSEQKQ